MEIISTRDQLFRIGGRDRNKRSLVEMSLVEMGRNWDELMNLVCLKLYGKNKH